MRLNLAAFAITVGVISGAAILLIATANAIWPSYGTAFLDLAVSIYPGYHRGQAIGQVLTGTLYALVDGAIWGGAFAWLYNLLSRRFSAGDE